MDLLDQFENLKTDAKLRAAEARIKELENKLETVRTLFYSNDIICSKEVRMTKPDFLKF